MAPTRIEKDFLGEVEIPADAYYGVQTMRAVRNFPVSGLRAHAEFIAAMGRIKEAAAAANETLGALPPKIARVVVQAAREVSDGKLDSQFVVDVYQAGAGTSFHMNANEVIANRALELLGEPRGNYRVVHPNDHVNLGQSTNDVYPTAMRVAALSMLPALQDALRALARAFETKKREFIRVTKSGRTHLSDAAPMTLGQEFGGYARALARSLDHLAKTSHELFDVGIGGSAVGTGLTAPEGFRPLVVKNLAALTGLPLRPSANTFESMQSCAPFAMTSGALRALALELIRIANDLRLLSSGPNTGLGEITLPAVQPGSSIMPGKVNPVIPEMMNMVAFQVVGFDAGVACAVQAGQLELNVMMPLINYNLLESTRILTNAISILEEKCVRGISPREDTCRLNARRSVGLATLLKPLIGYEKASDLARESVRTGKSIGELAVERGYMTEKELEDALLRPAERDPDGPRA
ncbi:MAG: aspartate ammonia-lyase [Planctomycetota bacterium]